MSEIREDRYYTKTHEWVMDNKDGTYTLGITDHAQELLGDMVYIDLPALGDTFIAGSEFCVVESVKAASGVYSPSDIVVIEINESLANEPELVNSSCYDKGWLVKFSSDNKITYIDSSCYEKILEED